MEASTVLMSLFLLPSVVALFLCLFLSFGAPLVTPFALCPFSSLAERFLLSPVPFACFFLPSGAPFVLHFFPSLFSSQFERRPLLAGNKPAALVAYLTPASESYLTPPCQYTSASMDPAGRIEAALQSQEARLNTQGQIQQTMLSRMEELTSQVHELVSLSRRRAPASTGQIPPPEFSVPTTPFTGVGLRLASPERYSGEPGRCQTFLTECDIHFEHLPQAFPTARSRVAFMVSHLTGRAKTWATAEWARGSSVCQSVQDFQIALRRVFDPENHDREKARALSRLQQGKESVSDYAIRFRTLATDSGWNAIALHDHFLKGLSPAIQELLVPVDLPADLDALISLAIRTDHRRQELAKIGGPRRREEPTPWTRTPEAGRPRFIAPSRPEPGEVDLASDEPMQLGRARLSPEERQRRRREGRCYYCGGLGHLVESCSTKGHSPICQPSSTPDQTKVSWTGSS
ncbi:uncharacterized protein LOC144004213 [Festucalex cinctus]